MKISPIEKRITQNLARIREKPVSLVMVPKSEICALRYDSPLREVVRIFNDCHYTRYPVYYRAFDQVAGILHVKDIIAIWNDHAADSVIEYARLPHFISEYRTALETLVEFQSLSVSLGIVLDEFGTVTGLVTMERLLAEIIGDFGDEPVIRRRVMVERISDREFVVQARIDIDDFAREFNVALDDQDVSTLAGLLIKHSDRIPQVGDEIIVKGLKITVLAGTRRRIAKVKIERL